MAIEIVEDTFGTYPGEPGDDPTVVRRFTMTNTATGFSAQVITYGATLTTLTVPGRSGELDDIVLGFDDIDEYLSTDTYFGGTIGRSSNRVSRGQFNLDGTLHQLSLNDGENHLHGGFKGFDKRMWEATVNGTCVTFTYLCREGEEGYPGDVLAQVSFEITLANELVIEYQAISSKPSPVAFTNHTYFNLAGHQNADKKLAGHYVRINADNITPVDDNLIITGDIMPVEGTMYDLRARKNLFALLQEFPNGYDTNFCLNPGSQTSSARFEDIVSGRVMEVATNQLGLQFYTSNFMSETVPIVGKGGAGYFKHGAFCAETQNYPDAVNNENFPNAILRPGNSYNHRAVYKFSIN